MQLSQAVNNSQRPAEIVGGNGQELVAGLGCLRRVSKRMVAGLNDLAEGGVELHVNVRLLLCPAVMCQNPANARDQVARADRL